MHLTEWFFKVNKTIWFCGTIALLALYLLTMLMECQLSSQLEDATESYDPCCSFPCQHVGICVSPDISRKEGYSCDCTTTGYYGINCEILRVGAVDEPCLYNGVSDYPSWESYRNTSVYVRTAPPVPLNCPTPMGVKGKKELPDVDVLINKFFKRKKFIPCSRRTSIVYPFFAQHFTHQFFKTDPGKRLPYQRGDQAVDLSHIYGVDYARQHALRSHVDGKMKVSLINGEVFPPNVKDADVEMDGIDDVPDKYRFAIGHPGFTMQPPLIFFATIWLKEHNRVCDVLKKVNPTWDDERLFQTARLILTGETLKVVVENYVQHLTGYDFQLTYEPDLLHGEGISYHNQVAVEFQLIYRWHALMPDRISVHGQHFFLRDLIFNPGPFVEAGIEKWYNDSRQQFAGQFIGGHNHGIATLDVAENAILDSRRLRIQPLNNYRKRLGLEPYKSFSQFTDDPEMAKELEDLYGDVDALELFVGVMLENRQHPMLFGQTLAELGSPYSLRGIFSNPIGSPHWWKPSTFGGDIGFNIVKTANLKTIFCNNINGCPDFSFEVPKDVDYNIDEYKCPETDDTSQIVMKENWERDYEDEVDPKDAPKWEINNANAKKTDKVKREL